MILKRKISDKLLSWKNNTEKRKPLLLQGARQVGKTYLLREFGRDHYRNTVYFDLAVNKNLRSLFSSAAEPVHIINSLELISGEQIIAGETLIILDEIQTCEQAMAALVRFQRETPDYHIAGTGSLFGIACSQELYLFTAGNTEVITLYPLDFEEFLAASGEEPLRVAIKFSFSRKKPLSSALHARALEIYRTYLITGGMPGAVLEYLNTGSPAAVSDIQRRIVNDYLADISRYASAPESSRIRSVYDSIPAQLEKSNRKFLYKPVRKGGTAVIFNTAVSHLTSSGIVLRSNRVEHAYLPVSAYRDFSSFKLYFNDVGILTMAGSIPHHFILSEDSRADRQIDSLNENYAAQTLVNNGNDLYYWTSGGIAGVDFILRKNTQIIPVEVRTGGQSRARSINLFMKKYKSDYSIRISSGKFNHTGNTMHVPYYAVFCI